MCCGENLPLRLFPMSRSKNVTCCEIWQPSNKLNLQPAIRPDLQPRWVSPRPVRDYSAFYRGDFWGSEKADPRQDIKVFFPQTFQDEKMLTVLSYELRACNVWKHQETNFRCSFGKSFKTSWHKIKICLPWLFTTVLLLIYKTHSGGAHSCSTYENGPRINWTFKST